MDLGAADVEAAHGVAEAQLVAAGAQVGGGLVDVEAAERDLGDAEARGVAGAEEGALGSTAMNMAAEETSGSSLRVPQMSGSQGVAQGGGLAEAT